ncbi:hypothetical protein OUZ56_011723 [Daphnia magna]|uniref:Uncharacterized protein n=1 Tax=Daphnia magna TaxID=35525 RepID=A0ABQ9Z115_9CRUS|nr:hypothetical protein OUZ56_011723 [Daphnia magna]
MFETDEKGRRLYILFSSVTGPSIDHIVSFVHQSSIPLQAVDCGSSIVNSVFVRHIFNRRYLYRAVDC